MENQKYYVVGSTHIDLAWKKDEAEMAEMLDVFVIRLLDTLESNPEFTYVLEQAYHFRSLNERRPDLVRRLKKFINEGRLEFVGGLASTLETNIPNGECFVRNQMIGINWVKEHFDADIRTGWLIDTFGLNAQIPQILNQFGIKHLLANRFGGTHYHDVFIDKGLDGSEIMVVGKDACSAHVKPGHFYFDFYMDWNVIDKLFDASQSVESSGPVMVMPYTENELLTSIRSVDHLNKIRKDGKGQDWGFGIPADFFRALEKTNEAWPVVFGDLNPEFTATFCQRINIRTRNRKTENLLLEAEKWAALQSLKSYKASLEDAWWTMSFNHFHDVFTGSHPTKVYQDVMNYFDSVDATALQILQNTEPASIENNNNSLKVINGLPFDRKDIVELTLKPDEKGVKKITCQGKDMPFEVIGDRLRILADLPACSVNILNIESGNKIQSQETPVGYGKIENEFILLECDNQMGLKRLTWKPTGKVLIENADDFLVVQQDEGSFQIESPTGSEVAAGAGTLYVKAYDSSPVCSRISLGGVFPSMPWAGPDNLLEWEAEFSLVPGKPVLYFKLKVNWKGEVSRIRLKLATSLPASEGIYEIPFGVVKRKPYGARGTARGEWPAHRFTIVEDAEYGVALINTGVPGVEIAGGTLWTTILRAPKSEYAGMVVDDSSSQHGEHAFDFAIVPYKDGWEDSGVITYAQEINNPCLALLFTGVKSEQDGISKLSLKPDNLVLSTVKDPEDGSDELIVRFYETTGKEVQGSLWVGGAESAWQSDLKETRLEAIECKEGQLKVNVKPFEIKTIRVKRR